MPIASTGSGWFDPPVLNRQRIWLLVAASLVAGSSFVVWPRLGRLLLATNYLPHLYCYLKSPGLIWTHVIADCVIGTAYLAISVNLGYLVSRASSDIPFHWMFLAFGVFIIACGATHFMEVLTIWVPAYVLAATVKVFTAAASLTTAAFLPFTTSRVFGLVEQAKLSDRVTAELRASEERKEALLREVHHRVKNNLAMICSLFYLQSTSAGDDRTMTIFREMENRVHSMALVHETLYGSENLARIDFAEYAKVLAENILGSYGNPAIPVRLETDLDPVVLSVDLALPCGLILNELVSNAFKHGFPNGSKGEIRLSVHPEAGGKYKLCVQDNGVGIPADLKIAEYKSLGMRLVKSLARQIGASFEVVRLQPGTSAILRFGVENHA